MRGSVLIFVCLLGLSLGFEDITISQWLEKNNYNTMVAALKDTGMYQTLDTTGPFTVFVPTDAVFNKLGADVVSSLLNDTAKLELIIKYHVINEYVIVPMISGPINKTTLDGDVLVIEPSAGGLLINNNSRVSAGNNDIVLNNGVVQPIDQILLPSNLPSLTLVQTMLVQDGEFADLVLSLIMAKLTAILDQGTYTVFGPTDAAFGQYKSNVLDPQASNAGQVYSEILKYHVVPGRHPSSELKDGQILSTLHGTTIAITVNATGVFANTARVIDADIFATNGVIHGIDDLLIPQDFQQLMQG